MEVEGRSRTISLPVELPRSWFYSLPLTLSAASMVLTGVYLFLEELAVLAGEYLIFFKGWVYPILIFYLKISLKIRQILTPELSL